MDIRLYKKLFTVAQIRQLESLAINHYEITEQTLMRRAGQAAYDLLRLQWPKAQSILVCCGKGNNGGDGKVLATLAEQDGLVVTRYTIGEELPQSSEYDVIVDALLGIGLQGHVREDYRKVIEWINQSQVAVLAIDCPSGIDVDSGNVMGIAVKAAKTMTYIGYKRGLFTGEAVSYTGNVFVNRLGLPKAAFDQVPTNCKLIHDDLLKNSLAKRSRSQHKGAYGHVLVIGGNVGMAGAARMASEAAVRVGAGLVSLATHPQHAGLVTSNRPEIMSHPVHTEHDFSPLLAKATVIALGPGLGKDEWAQQMFNLALQSELPMVIDADALNLLTELSHHRDTWVLTPHPGEAARLLNTDSASIQANRFAAAEALVQRYGGVCVLKGAGTLIQHNHTVAVCSKGNPGMASGGMGDVLTGVIAGLLAQHLPLPLAAEVGVECHALAADKAAIEGERGLIASDVIAELRKLVNP